MVPSQRVAVLSMQRLGDVLTARRVTAGLAALPEVASVEVIHWDSTHAAASLLPGVTRLHSLPYGQLRALARQAPVTALAALRDHLRTARGAGFDRVVNVTSTRFSCLVAPWLANGAAMDGPVIDDTGAYSASHPAMHYLNDWGVVPESNVFVHQDLYTLAAGVALAAVAPLPPDRIVQPSVARDIPYLCEGPIAFHVRSSAADKDWRPTLDVNGWRGLAEELQRRCGVPIVLMGSDRDLPELCALAESCGAHVCVRPLSETAEVLRVCRGLISVDTVAIHLAAAVDCPTIVLRQGSARGLAFVPGPSALLVDEAREHASVADLVALARRHFRGLLPDDGAAPELGRQLLVRQAYVDAHGFLGARAPAWLPTSATERQRDENEAAARERWHRKWNTDSSTLSEVVGW